MASPKMSDIESTEKVSPYIEHNEFNSDVPYDSNSERNRKLVRKQDLRIVPMCAFMYLLCYLDRSNIGNAKVLNSEHKNDLLSVTKMTNSQYLIALLVFLVAYAIFEVPSNYFLKQIRPSRWIAFLMVSWGACTIGLGGVHNFAQVTAVRFLLGVFEAGLFPGLVYYLTFWYRTEERSIRVAAIFASATLAGAFGGALAYGIGHMNGYHGLVGWRWLFILEGIPSMLFAIVVWFFLPDFPERASWLSAEEREFAKERLANQGSDAEAPRLNWAIARATLADWRLWCHYLIYFGTSSSFSSLSLFTPTITAGLGYTSLEAQLMTVPPYAVAYVVTILVAWSSDHYNARSLHSATMAAIGACGFMAQALLPPTAYKSRYGCLIVAASGTFSCIPPLLGWLSSNIHNTAATGLAIALNISCASPGQILGLYIFVPKEKMKGYTTGHSTNAGLLFMVAVGCLGLRFYYGWRNRKFARGEGNGMVREFRY